MRGSRCLLWRGSWECCPTPCIKPSAPNACTSPKKECSQQQRNRSDQQESAQRKRQRRGDGLCHHAKRRTGGGGDGSAGFGAGPVRSRVRRSQRWRAAGPASTVGGGTVAPYRSPVPATQRLLWNRRHISAVGPTGVGA